MIALDDVLARVEDVRRTSRGYSAKCPGHRDGRASLSIRARDDGRGVLLHCFASCTYGEIVRALKLDPPARDDGGRRSLDVHALALRLARSQRWADPQARAIARCSRYVRECDRAAETVRAAARAAGDTAATWDALALAARCETEARRVEYALDEALV
jgi:hypothetical protein